MGQNIPPTGQQNKSFHWLLLVFAVLAIMSMFGRYSPREDISNDEFEKYIAEGKVESIEIGDNEIVGKFNAAGEASRQAKATKMFRVGYRTEMLNDLVAKLQTSPVPVKWTFAKPQWLIPLLGWILPVLVMIAFFYFVFVRNVQSRV